MLGALIREINSDGEDTFYIVEKVVQVSNLVSLMDIKNMLNYAYAVAVDETVKEDMIYKGGIIYDRQTNDQVYPPLSAVEQIEKLNNIIAELTYNVDTSTLDVPALKDYLIKKNKKNLEDYFYDHPMCVNGKYYTITEDKQNQATGVIQAYVLAQQFGVTDLLPQLTWNETSGECTPITLQDLYMLYLQMLAVAKPIVSYQQHTETLIRTAEDRDTLLAIDITFDNYTPTAEIGGNTDTEETDTDSGETTESDAISDEAETV